MTPKNIIERGQDYIIIQLNVMLLKEDDSFVAYCPALELSSFGDSPEDAQKAFHEALEIFIEETSNKGTFDNELLSLGWTLKKKPEPEYYPPLLIGTYKQLLSTGASSIKENVKFPV
jgi:predicted RNase H-like HicB family nuclease